MNKTQFTQNSHYCVLITGAANRIGKQIAFYFASKGYNLAIHYNNSDEGVIKTKNEIKAKYDVNCEVFKADFRNQEETINLVSEVQSYFKIKHLVNNASLFYENTFLDGNLSDFDIFMEINFKAPYLLTKEFSKIAEDGACILNILDTKVVRNQTKHFDYLLTKKFLEVFTKQVAYELAPKIRVNGIAPGIILPPKGKDEEYINKMAKNIPMKVSGDTDNITHAVDFLINNNFVTGQILFVDGGENL